MNTLPPFLQPTQQRNTLSGPWINAIYHHDSLEASAHAIWWPSVAKDVATVLLFIPGKLGSCQYALPGFHRFAADHTSTRSGNPGLIEFYIPYLTALYEKTERKLAILAHAHLGHSPTVPYGDTYKHPQNIGLTAQIESALQAAVALRSTFLEAKVVVAGHSMGSWITLQVKPVGSVS